MKKRFIKSLGLVLCMIVLIGMSGTTASKAKSKNTIKVTLTVGKTYQLKVTGTKKKIKWNTSNKKVATVSSKGKIKAKKAGKAKIYAKVGKKKLICYLTVKSKKTKKSKNSKANTSTTKKPANTNTTVQPSVTQTPANTVAPIAPVSPTGVPGVTEKPSATVQPDATPISTPQYTDGPKLEQTYHANLCFSTDDFSFYEEGCGEYIKNTTNGFHCTDSLGNYISDDSYKVNYQETTIDHAGMYSFKISGINNMLQNAKDFYNIYITTDIGLNKNVVCKNLELYIDGTLIDSVENVVCKSNTADDEKWTFWLKSVWLDSSILDKTVDVPIPKESIEVRCYFDPGQVCSITTDDVKTNYNKLREYICNNNYKDFTYFLENERKYIGIIFEDQENLYVISCEEDSIDNQFYFSQCDKNTKKVKASMYNETLYGNMHIGYSTQNEIELDGYVNVTGITPETNISFSYENGNVAGSALNTEANQEFQRSLKGWNQLLNERLHMSLKDFGFVSYE